MKLVEKALEKVTDKRTPVIEAFRRALLRKYGNH